ncbi:glycosyltransferase family 87 protein [Nocardioides sp.]|uniref:glycosyltransferase family 87 protein n=1 Tax=Nocardioides sp. TaxID=35761 RepID=UPI003D0A5C0E
MTEPVTRATQDDPVLRSASEVIGGPAGDHSRGHPWWTPVRVLLVVAAVCCALGMVQKAGCFNSTWQNGDQRYTQMCYSDLPYLYTGRGFAELTWPYTDDAETRARYETMEYPVGISYVAYATAVLTHLATGSPELSARAQQPVGELWNDPEVVTEIRTFVSLSAILFALMAIVSTYLLAQVNPRRPWDALGFAASPALLLTGLVNWDLLAVVLVAGALWAWARGRPVLTGVLIGLGVATKLYPLFLLGGLLVICLRQRRLTDLVRVTVAAALSWILVNAPAYVTGPEQWKVFWHFNSERTADLGSIWLVLSQLPAPDHAFSAHTINVASWLFFSVWCLGVLLVGLRAPVTPRFAQLGFVIVAGFLLVNKVYSPQYVLWLLPLAVLARPRWRDLLIWQAGEVFYFASVWWYLGGELDSSTADGGAPVYWIAIVLRIAAQLYLVAVVVRDMLRPWHDPVDRDEPEDYSETSTRSKSVAV